MLLCFGNIANAQLTGVKAIPGDYATISAAVTDLNTVGVGAGGVTFNIAAGYVENLTGRIAITATGTMANPIIFQKSGVGVNPVLNAYTGVNTPTSAERDGMISLQGSDYITIDGLDFMESPANVTIAQLMEYGIGLFRASATNGAQSNTIKNCTIVLSRENDLTGSGVWHPGSNGIAVLSCSALANAAITPTAASGSNSFNKFYSNTISNVSHGIVFIGYAAPTPFTLADTGNDVGGSSAITGNTILNYGGKVASTATVDAVFINNQWSINCSYNTINNNDGSGANHLNILRGIWLNASSTSASATVNNNHISLYAAGTTQVVTGIENNLGSTAASNTVNINNNYITGNYLTATTGVFYGIWNVATAATVTMNGNTIENLEYSSISLTGTGVLYPIYNSGAATTVTANNNTVKNIKRYGTTGATTIGIYFSAGTNQTIKNNLVYDMAIDGTGATSTMYGIQTSTGTIIVDSNIVRRLSCIKTTGTGSLYGIYNIASATNENYNYNQIDSLEHLGTGTTYGLYSNTVAGVRTMSFNTIHTISTNGNTAIGLLSTTSSPNIFNNRIYNIEARGAAATTAFGISITTLGASGAANIYNNVIGDIKTPNSSVTAANTAPQVRGISCTVTTATSNVAISYNTVYLDASSSGTNFGSAALFITANATPTTAALTLRNNLFVNNSIPAGNGRTVAYQRSAVALNNYTNASSNNSFYAGVPGASNLIFSDGTNNDETINDFKTRITPRETASFSENPTFLSIIGADASFLHLSPSVGTQLESGGVTITGITTDFDGNTRNVNTPDIGADEFNGIAVDLSAPSISIATLSTATICTDARTVTATIIDGSGVSVAAGVKPRLWFKKETENDVFPATNTSASNGWKWVEATNNASPFNFTFNYSLLSSAIIAGDSVQYFISAQDSATTPNVAATTAILSDVPTTAALGVNSFPVSGNIKGFMILNQPVPIIIQSNVGDVCYNGNVSLSVDGIDVTGGSLKWQSSPTNANTWSDIAGATNSTYTTLPLLQGTDFRLHILCGVTPIGSSPSNTVAITVNNPTITSTTPATRCGVGTVTLSANAPGYNLKWYDTAVAGSSLYTGNSFVTTTLTANKNYYAAAFTPGGGGTGTLPIGAGSTTSATYSNPFYSLWSNLHTQHIVLASELNAAGIYAGEINGIGLDVTAAGTLPMIDFSLKIGTTSVNTMAAFQSSGSFSTVYTSASLMPTTGINTLQFNTPFNWDGVSNIILEFCHGNSGSSATMSRTVKADVTAYVSSIKTHTSAATSAATQCPNETTNLLTYSLRPQFYFSYVGDCEGARVLVPATITAPPAINVSTPLAVICENGSTTLNVASSNSNYVYTWEPLSVNGGSINVSPTATTKYIVTADDAGTNCTAVDSITITVQPTPTVTSTPQSFCVVGGVATLKLTPTTGYAANSIQWQSSPDNSTFTDIAGANAASYVTPSISTTTYYKALIKNSANAVCSQPVYTVLVSDPQVTGTTPGSRCGPGSVTLEATGSGGATLNWYANASGGSPLNTGTSFITPSIATSTPYYVAAINGTTNSAIGLANAISTTGNTGYTDVGLMFDAYSQFTLQSVAIYPIGTGGAATVTIDLKNSAGTTIQTYTANVTTAPAPGVKTVIPLNFVVPAGTGYRLVANGASGLTSLIRESLTANFTYPYTIAGYCSITSAYTSGASAIYYYYFYDWQISTGCEGPRTAVIASINTTPAITKAALPAVICAGANTQLTTSSTNSGYTYTWNPGNLTGSSVSVSPTATTKYFVSATDNSGGTFNGCSNIDSIVVRVNLTPTEVFITPSSANICSTTDPAVALTVSGGTIGGEYSFGTAATQNTNSTYPAPYSAYYGGQRMQMLITAAELTAQGVKPGTISKISFPVVSLEADWGVSTFACLDFKISMGTTALTSLTAFETGLTEVLPAYSFTPTVGYANEHTFTTPFVWDGTSNVIIETTFSNNNTGQTTDGVIQYNTPTSYQSTIVYRADGVTAAAAATATAVSLSYSARADFKLTNSANTQVTWSPVTDLFTNATATIAYTGTAAAIVYAKPTVTRTYTATSTSDSGCIAAKTVTITSNCVVPVNITSFKGEKRGNVNVLSWITSTEINNAGFELQRSVDGVSFAPLGYVSSKADNGNSTHQLTYNFNDVRPLLSTGYYRLKQIDKDGKFNYSSIVILRSDKKGDLIVGNMYPNPVLNILNLSIESIKNTKVEIVVVNTLGMRVHQQTANLTSGINIQTMNISKLAAGLYHVQIISSTGEVIHAGKVNKQ